MSAPLPGCLTVDSCGLTLASPLVLLSGASASARNTRASTASRTPMSAPSCSRARPREPRLGNPPHRVYGDPDGHAERHRPAQPGRGRRRGQDPALARLRETRFFANVCGSTIEDYVETTRRFEDSPIDAIEINISCPNIKEGGVQFGKRAGDVPPRVVAACRAVTKKPLITKLSPNQTDIRENARRCIEAGKRRPGRHQHGDGHGDRREDPQAGDRQRPGRAVRPGDQADRAAQGDAGSRGGAPLGIPIIGQAASRPRRTRSSSSSPAPPPWASAPRCSTTRWSAGRSTRASPTISPTTG